MARMTHRERVMVALNHRAPDRVPIDIGGGGSTGVMVEAYERLKGYLNYTGETKGISLLRCATIDEEILRELDVDFRPLSMKGPSGNRPFTDEEGNLIDEWGIKWRTVHHGTGSYREVSQSPLEEATIEDLERYAWPDPLDPARTAGLAEEAQNLYENSDYAIMGDSGFKGFWEIGYMLRGYERLITDLCLDPEFVYALFDKLLELNMAATGEFLKAVGPYIQVIRLADDLATQSGPLMSPEMYRRMLKPYHDKLIKFVKERTEAKIFYHSCGDVRPLINDLVEIGVDALNPVQVSAMGDTAELKSKFGDKICFWGGVDTQHVLPFGSPEEVREEVKRRIRDLGPGGGYILASVHSIQADVPPQNILAMVEAAKEFGSYPIRC